MKVVAAHWLVRVVADVHGMPFSSGGEAWCGGALSMELVQILQFYVVPLH